MKQARQWCKAVVGSLVLVGCTAALQAQAHSYPEFSPVAPVSPFNNDPLTGQWRFTFVISASQVYADLPAGFSPPAGIVYAPAGTVADSGFVTWHDDGTDFIHSSHVPATDAVAEGTWRRAGNTYQANNWALPWDLPPDVANPTFQGPVNIQEWITLDKDGQTYSGTFKLTFYLPPPSSGAGFVFDTSGGKAVEIVGTVEGERVTWSGFPHQAALD